MLNVFKSSVKKKLMRAWFHTGGPLPIGKSGREYVRNHGTRKERSLYHEFALSTKKTIIEARRRLAHEYLSSNIECVIDRDFRIDPNQGISMMSLAGYPVFEDALTEAKQIILKRQGDELPSKGSLDFIASSKKDFDANSAISKLALDPNLMIPALRYLGIFPILFGFDINRARQKRPLRSSHFYHLDPEDTTQVKVFIYLNDVDNHIGPFTALPSIHSAAAIEQLNYEVGSRLKDEQVYGAIGYGHEIACTGPTGSIIFCDTNRCLHYGGRVQSQERHMLTIYYSLPTATWFPLYAGDGERRNLTPFLRPVHNTLLEKAALGEELVA